MIRKLLVLLVCIAALTGTAAALDLNSSHDLRYFPNDLGGPMFEVETDGTTTLYGNLDMQNTNNIQNFFASECDDDQVITRIHDDGDYTCEPVPANVTVEGDGTTDHLAKFADGDTITDSQIYDDGTNVGIGTTSPSSQLEVDGSLDVSGELDVGDVHSTTADDGPVWEFDGADLQGAGIVAGSYTDDAGVSLGNSEWGFQARAGGESHLVSTVQTFDGVGRIHWYDEAGNQILQTYRTDEGTDPQAPLYIYEETEIDSNLTVDEDITVGGDIALSSGEISGVDDIQGQGFGRMSMTGTNWNMHMQGDEGTANAFRITGAGESEAFVVDDSGDVSIPGGNLDMGGNNITTVNNMGFEGGVDIGAGDTMVQIGVNAVANDSGNIAVGAGSQAMFPRSTLIGRNTRPIAYDIRAVTAVGYDAGEDSVGDELTTVGYRSSREQTGDQVSALGYRAADGNEGDEVAVVGTEAGQINTGEGMAGLGYGAAKNNTGEYTSAIGWQTAEDNLGERVTAIGATAGRYNTGHRSAFTGNRAGEDNTGNRVSSLGYEAARDNEGAYAVALGYGAGYGNQFDNTVSLGAYTDTGAEGAVAIGHEAIAPNAWEATFGNLQGEELDVNVTGDLTVHENLDMTGGVIENCDQINGVDCDDLGVGDPNQNLSEVLVHGNRANTSIDMAGNVIENIGDTGTDFDSSGGLTLADDLDTGDSASITGDVTERALLDVDLGEDTFTQILMLDSPNMDIGWTVNDEEQRAFTVRNYTGTTENVFEVFADGDTVVGGDLDVSGELDVEDRAWFQEDIIQYADGQQYYSIVDDADRNLWKINKDDIDPNGGTPLWRMHYRDSDESLGFRNNTGTSAIRMYQDRTVAMPGPGVGIGTYNTGGYQLDVDGVSRFQDDMDLQGNLDMTNNDIDRVGNIDSDNDLDITASGDICIGNCG